MIPKILHYVWVGGPLPDVQAGYITTWREANPDFQIICWDEQNIDMTSEIIRSAYREKKWAKVADIARLQAVARMGGIYLDTDFRAYRTFSPMLRHQCFFAFQEVANTPDWVCNGVFGAEPDHWFIKKALDGLYAMKPKLFIPERPTSFGPKHITRLLKEAGLQQYSKEGVMVGDIFIAPTPVFFPFHFREEFTPSCITDETLAVHFWEKSWEKSVPLPIRLAKKYIRKLYPI
jgi:mannosyltransferase OCH1-like enzyme